MLADILRGSCHSIFGEQMSKLYFIHCFLNPVALLCPSALRIILVPPTAFLYFSLFILALCHVGTPVRYYLNILYSITTFMDNFFLSQYIKNSYWICTSYCVHLALFLSADVQKYQLRLDNFCGEDWFSLSHQWPRIVLHLRVDDVGFSLSSLVCSVALSLFWFCSGNHVVPCAI